MKKNNSCKQNELTTGGRSVFSVGDYAV